MTLVPRRESGKAERSESVLTFEEQGEEVACNKSRSSECCEHERTTAVLQVSDE
jgi:hypothetical protein